MWTHCQNDGSVHQSLQSVGQCRVAILERFDPDAVEEDLRISLEQRTLLKAANRANDLHLDYSPFFDATRQYCR